MLSSFVQLDHLMRAWVVTHRVGALDAVMWTLSAIGRGGALFALIGLALTFRRRRARDFAQVGLALVLASVVADYILKPAVHRERPFLATPEVHVIGGRPHDASFPSGHSASAFAGATALSALSPGGSAIWWTLALAIAYSRVYLGVHYPADVIAGALLGIIAGLVASIVCERVAARTSRGAPTL